jgi:hypothetical protein
MKIELDAAQKENKSAHIAVDFDGTLAHYEGWSKQGNGVGKPIKKMVDNIKSWLQKGYHVSIFTARLAHSPTEADHNVHLIRGFLEENGLPKDMQITCMKMPYFTHFIDDKAYHVKMNSGIIESNPDL